MSAALATKVDYYLRNQYISVLMSQKSFISLASFPSNSETSLVRQSSVRGEVVL